ncbi:glycosyltransferase family 4 protein [Sphingobacterium paucimobilis]|uniref:Uncharacterized protein n=1 Tax=Sphingobacterium paucimobilis HER1398 TaxID=1346330 RepID=U2JDA1_9SPHI|nr:glycosyltransferase family 1 protein [Sphingobacterium paucimobilis]ERJ60633.1 hypothetical protein M472_17900 [Sphingobacterium paucimobilis HER1398]
MKVLYDYQAFLMQNYGGVSRYFGGLIEGLKATPNFHYSLRVIGGRNYHLSDLDRVRGNLFFRDKYRKSPHKATRINQKKTLKVINDGNFDVFHPTYYNGYFLKSLKKPLVITVHDMTYEKYPVFFNPNDSTPYDKRKLLEKADKIIAISQTTKNDILYYNDIEEDKIEVIYHGIDLKEELSYHRLAEVPESFILYVGSRFGYKNFVLFVEAFAQLSAHTPDLHLVIVGADLGIAEQELLFRLKVLDKTKVVAASDSELNFLYKEALFFVYPSLYEGFGLPILEAFRVGCPVLLSKASCFPEVAGDSACYFDANSIESLVDNMQVLLESEALRKEMAIRGKEKVREYDLKVCIDKTFRLYSDLV